MITTSPGWATAPLALAGLAVRPLRAISEASASTAAVVFAISALRASHVLSSSTVSPMLVALGAQARLAGVIDVDARLVELADEADVVALALERLDHGRRVLDHHHPLSAVGLRLRAPPEQQRQTNDSSGAEASCLKPE